MKQLLSGLAVAIVAVMLVFASMPPTARAGTKFAAVDMIKATASCPQTVEVVQTAQVRLGSPAVGRSNTRIRQFTGVTVPQLARGLDVFHVQRE